MLSSSYAHFLRSTISNHSTMLVLFQETSFLQSLTFQIFLIDGICQKLLLETPHILQQLGPHLFIHRFIVLYSHRICPHSLQFGCKCHSIREFKHGLYLMEKTENIL